jgi:hypothetical protein
MSFSKLVSARNRRKTVVARLEKQLVLNEKPLEGKFVPLTEGDTKRINKELATLKERV